MSGVFSTGLEPALLWRYFDLIRSTPHGSGNEAALRDKIANWAKERNFKYEVDEIGNLVVRVPASAGMENHSTAVLQSHIDMVCEKNANVNFDFQTQGIEVTLDGDFIKSVGTTLGADNGIGMAAAMAIADDADAAHGPLELLFTVQEETGMYGAFALKPDFISGRWLLNLDTEEEAAIYVGCAGGGDVRSIFDIRSQARSEGKKCIRIQITGLAGGHSGLDIHLNRANAIKCLARILYAIDRAKLEFQICNIQGGTMRNAIPREASCDACIDSNQLTALREIVNNISSELTSEFAATDPDLLIYCDVRPQCQCQQNFTPEFTSQLILSLVANPSGVGSMSRDVEGLVETSNNLGVIRTHSDKIEVVNCTRSTNAIALEALRQSIAAIHRLAGATVSLEPSYPGWQPKMDSPLLKIALDTHQNLFGPAKIKAVHAGLECGLIGQIYPQLDMISIGPTIKGAHSPAERVSISSTQKFYSHLKQLLANIP